MTANTTPERWTTVTRFEYAYSNIEHTVLVEYDADDSPAYRLRWVVGYDDPPTVIDEYTEFPGARRCWEHVETFHHAYEAYARLATLAFAVEFDRWPLHPGDTPEEVNEFLAQLTSFTNWVTSPWPVDRPDRPSRYPWPHR